MFRVEFLGLPGVGKTSIRKKLLEKLKRIDSSKYLTMEEAFFHVSREEIDKFYRILLRSLPGGLAKKLCIKMMNRSYMHYKAQNDFLAKWGRAFDIFLRSREFYVMPPSDRAIVIGGFLQTGACFTCIDREIFEKRIVFFDEGFVQKSFMFISSGSGYDQGKSPLNSYLTSIPLPHMIIFIKGDLKVCLDRMVNRRKGLTRRLKQAKESEVIDFLGSSQKHLQQVTGWLRENSNVHLVEVSNEDAFDRVVGSLENSMIEFFGEARDKAQPDRESGSPIMKAELSRRLMSKPVLNKGVDYGK